MAKKQICGNKWISLWENDHGTITVKMDDGVSIVVVNEKNEVILITEPSPAYDGMRSLLVPTGGLEPGEDPAECANRELQEEIGLKANRLDALGVIYQSIKYVDAKAHVFLARDLEAATMEGDEPEGWIEAQQPVPLSEIENLIAAGKLLNAEAIAALFLARSFIENESA